MTAAPRGQAPLADRNIDTVMLTTNLTDIEMRMKNEQGSTPLDGLHTQVRATPRWPTSWASCSPF